MTDYYAHTKDGDTPEHWQPLEEHLKAVADLAEANAYKFGSGEWGRLAGQWHDLGKFSSTFQNYLLAAAHPDPHVSDSAARTDHSTAGAQYATGAIEILGHLLAYVISGHHSGLLDGLSDGPCLEARLRKEVEPWEHGCNLLPEMPAPHAPLFLRSALGSHDAFTVSFFVRMLFSCLVDADFLDTELFMDRNRAESRPTWPPDILPLMEAALNRYLKGIQADSTPVNRERAAVRNACLDAAALEPGLFSLTVPTGGGKTLSSLAFALRHAFRHELQRVIYVIPFTSIIEQNADVFREVMAPLRASLGHDPVLEHHSNIDAGEETVTSRLSTENWDAPLVVTTSVQFYESLFANRTSRCRKLHNLVNSVVILDEVQTLPVDYLDPCLRALRELAENYGASVVLCTATQPAIHYRNDFPIGLQDVREIIPEPRRLYSNLKRVKLEDIGAQDDAVIAERLLEEERVLCIVNTRSHARTLFDALGESEGHFHLSALMCPEHRSEVLKTLRLRLDEGRECRVISTQLIEAGIDIDFPVVYRSLAGLDSVAQAAGRCNRNGVLEGLGRTFIFRSEHIRSERFLAETVNSAAQVLDLHDDPLSLEAVEHYFKLYYWDQSSRWDAKHILHAFDMHNDRAFPFSFGFAGVARDFHLIESTGETVIIPWGDRGRTLGDRLRLAPGLPGRDLLRQLQRYTVQIPRRIWNQHIGRSIELVHDRYPVLICPEMHYSEQTGLSLEEEQAVYLEV